MATIIRADSPTTVIAAASAAGSAPNSGSTAYKAETDGGLIRTFFDYTGTVTACNVRLYLRAPGTTSWFRAAATDDSVTPLAPSSGDESRDWEIGEGTEFTFVVDSISQSGGGTVAVSVVGVNR